MNEGLLRASRAASSIPEEVAKLKRWRKLQIEVSDGRLGRRTEVSGISEATEEVHARGS